MQADLFTEQAYAAGWSGRNRKLTKSLLLASCFVLLLVLRVRGQGIVDFENGVYPPLAISTNSIPAGPATGLISGAVGSYYFGLFSAPSGTTDPALFTFTGDYATNLTIAGTIYGGFPYPAIPGTQPYQTVSLLVRGWSANIGHDFSQVTAYLANPTFTGWYAQSQIGTLPLGDPNGISPPPLLFGTTQDPGFTQILGFTLNMYEVPEPKMAPTLFAALWLSYRRTRPRQLPPRILTPC